MTTPNIEAAAVFLTIAPLLDDGRWTWAPNNENHGSFFHASDFIHPSGLKIVVGSGPQWKQWNFRASGWPYSKITTKAYLPGDQATKEINISVEKPPSQIARQLTTRLALGLHGIYENLVQKMEHDDTKALEIAAIEQDFSSLIGGIVRDTYGYSHTREVCCDLIMKDLDQESGKRYVYIRASVNKANEIDLDLSRLSVEHARIILTRIKELLPEEAQCSTGANLPSQ